MSDVLYRIQRGPRFKPIVVHHNKLKPGHYREKPDLSWLPDLVESKEQDVNNLVEPCDKKREILRPKRPSRAPPRYGEWYYGQ